ncbi:MAG: serine/threonine protein kinase, partial [Deinococcales bacterium]|nr:serine/threonine protein kinase [Chitinophagaceae bacterium]
MEILNKYRYDPQTDLLGRGGFATVYKAYDKVLDMPVALKFFQSQDAGNKYTIINEIKRAIILSHPNIVKYYGVETLINRNFHGQEEEVQIGVMEFVQEGQMKTFMTQNPLNLDQLKKLLIDILEGLKYLHSEGVIHRDIKPQNILLGRDKQNRLVAKIADFGISKSADSNQASASILLGTIEYMAPEQFNPERYGINKKIGYNVDIWAFGVTAYYLLTGNLLFGSRSGDTSAAQMISKIVNAEGLEKKLLLLNEPFKSALQKCIVSNANDRTNDIDEVIAILKGQQYKKDQNNLDSYAPNS